MQDVTQLSSLAELKKLFSTLAPPPAEMRAGFYRATFIGPWWLRLSGRPSVALGGLPGWQGKRFLSPTTATNILLKSGVTSEALFMQLESGVSQVDGKQGVALTYGADAPLPWRYIRDEVRAIDANRILGMTVINLPLLNKLGFPFLLVREA